jgi:hypothetical protein
MGATTVGRLRVMLAETGACGRPGTALLRRLLAVRTSDYVPPTGELEALLLAVVVAAGLDAPVRQAWVGGTQAPVGRVDFVIPQARVVIEADSRRYHSSWLDVQADHRRDLLLTAAGWRVIRVNRHSSSRSQASSSRRCAPCWLWQLPNPTALWLHLTAHTRLTAAKATRVPSCR